MIHAIKNIYRHFWSFWQIVWKDYAPLIIASVDLFLYSIKFQFMAKLQKKKKTVLSTHWLVYNTITVILRRYLTCKRSLKKPSGNHTPYIVERQTIKWIYLGKSTKEQTMIYKTLHRKQKIDQHEHHLKPWMNSCAPEEFLYKQFLLLV